MEARRRGRMAGTRGGPGRVAAMVIGLAALAALVLADAARAGTYEVAQCGWGVGAQLDPAAAVEGRGAGVVLDGCLDPAPNHGLRLEAAPLLAVGDGLKAGWRAAPGTAITALRGVWAGAMLPGYRQQLGVEEGGGFRPLVGATGALLPTPVAATLPTAAPSVAFRLVCLSPLPEPCRTTPPAWALVREVTLTVADALAPRARVGGPLLAAGWHRGKVALDLAADDFGAGVERLEAEVGGTPVALARRPCAAANIEGALRATEMRPCQAAADATVEVDTARLPDGTDTLRGCALDFAGNAGCAAGVPFRVDNSPPSVDFAVAEEGRVAASVFDPFSGPASGSIAMRRDDAEAWVPLPTEMRRDGPGKATLLASLPALQEGGYVLRAAAVDVAGNSASAATRVTGAGAGDGGADGDGTADEAADGAGGSGGPGPADGAGSPGADGAAGIGKGAATGAADSGDPSAGGHGDGRAPQPRGDRGTRLLAGLGGDRRGRARRSSLSVAFGTAATVAGRLTAVDGRGVAGRVVKVIARSSRGAARRKAILRATTDRHGRFALRLRRGPSRRLVVAFPGGDGLRPSRSRPLALRVHAAVTLTARPPSLRTGQTVRLRGRVARRGARIPRRGKLVAIQYLERDSRRWRPALVIRTGPGGCFHARYRFRYVTGSSRIRLRATALPEAGWPFASGSSAPLTVKVHGG